MARRRLEDGPVVPFGRPKTVRSQSERFFFRRSNIEPVLHVHRRLRGVQARRLNIEGSSRRSNRVLDRRTLLRQDLNVSLTWCVCWGSPAKPSGAVKVHWMRTLSEQSTQSRAEVSSSEQQGKRSTETRCIPLY